MLRSIRAQEGDPVPVLMLTAAADPDSASRGWADGVDYYLAKPFTAEDVLDLVEGALGTRVPTVGEDFPGAFRPESRP